MTEIGFDLPHECAIIRPEYRQGAGGEFDFGGDVEVRPIIERNIPCFVQNMKVGERERWSHRELDVDVKIYFTEEPNLREGDFILITLNTVGSSYVGQQFKFQGVDDATAGHGIAWKALCKRDVNPVEPVAGG